MTLHAKNYDRKTKMKHIYILQYTKNGHKIYILTDV